MKISRAHPYVGQCKVYSWPEANDDVVDIVSGFGGDVVVVVAGDDYAGQPSYRLTVTERGIVGYVHKMWLEATS